MCYLQPVLPQHLARRQANMIQKSFADKLDAGFPSNGKHRGHAVKEFSGLSFSILKCLLCSCLPVNLNTHHVPADYVAVLIDRWMGENMLPSILSVVLQHEPSGVQRG